MFLKKLNKNYCQNKETLHETITDKPEVLFFQKVKVFKLRNFFFIFHVTPETSFTFIAFKTLQA